MITIQKTGVREKALFAIQQAEQLDRPILVSEVQKIDLVDPLLFFHSGKERFLGERFLWKDPSDESVFAGLGIAKKIQSDRAADRFFYVDQEWQDFLTGCIVASPYQESGIGPLLFGGFSFDPLKKKTKLWEKFAAAQFFLPKYMLSIINGETFLTTNIVFTKNDRLSLVQRVIAEREQIFQACDQGFEPKQSRFIATKAIAPGEWKHTVAGIVKELKNGPLKKVVLARELRLFFDDAIAAESVLTRLFEEQHDSFIFAFEAEGDCFIGASPERLVKKQGRNVFSTCLAGSIKRGKTEAEDQRLGEQLLADVKNRKEHQFVVEMIKEALEEVCEDVLLPETPQLMKIRDIQHLYTPVKGICKEDASILGLVERLHPTPALGGLPKKEAVEKIREVEILDRGFYAGPLGWIDYKGNGEFAVAIRSGLIQDKEASLFAGCGVVADSDPESEFKETDLKFSPMLTALGGK